MKLFIKRDFTIKNSKVVLVPLGDIHFGHRNCDVEAFEYILKWLYEHKEAYVICMGDLLESATKDSIGAGVFEQTEFMQEQLDKMVAYLKPLADEGRIIGMLDGNHEYRIYKHSGLNPTKIMADMLKTKHFGYSINLRLVINKQSYEIHAQHGSTGAKTIQGKLKACMDTQLHTDSELYLMGHCHDLANYKKVYFKQNSRNKVIEEANKIFVLTGGYLRYYDGYAEMKNLLPSLLGSPKIKLHASKHQVRVSI